MARVEFAAAAVQDLDRLKRALTLPADTNALVRDSVATLADFPRLGTELEGRWRDYRFVLGPWRWMLVVYAYLADEDRVVVVTIQDARSSSSVQRT